MMHDNDFCRGCHIFVPSGQLFVHPDTGTYLLVNKPEGKHDSLSCHACHPFELKKQTQELFYWMIERPDKIPPHSKVPRDVCEGCHVTGKAKATWKRITTTAGHRTHLESDSASLKHVACLTCHARMAHRFQPADTTCAQQGCHFTDSIKIRLGRMETTSPTGTRRSHRRRPEAARRATPAPIAWTAIVPMRRRPRDTTRPASSRAIRLPRTRARPPARSVTTPPASVPTVISRRGSRQGVRFVAATMLDATHDVFRYWHVVHRPVALAALVAVLVHVGVVIVMGATWFR